MTDIVEIISREVLDTVTVAGRFELPPMFGTDYTAFCDPSGGSSDSMTLAISHRENDVAILDAVREVKPPFSPESVVQEFATLLKIYGVATVFGDRYAGLWPTERFFVHGITYEPSPKPNHSAREGRNIQ